MTFEAIGDPRIETEYSDEYETVMVIDLQNESGDIGDVWVVAGVPDYLRGTARASGSQRGLMSVRVFGDGVDMWCPGVFRVADADYTTIANAVVAACEQSALKVHRSRFQ